MRTPHTCATCGAEWFDTHTCPNAPPRLNLPTLSGGEPATYSLPYLPECRYCGKHHGVRYACDELLAAASREQFPNGG